MKLIAICLLVYVGVLLSAPEARGSVSELVEKCTQDSKDMNKVITSVEKMSEKLKKNRQTRIDQLEKRLKDTVKEQSKSLKDGFAQIRAAGVPKGPCPSPWVFARKDLCILIPTVQLNWADSQKYCKQRNGSLIVFDEEIDYKAAMRNVAKGAPCSWLGLRQVTGKKAFERTDGSKSKPWYKWMSKQPDFKDHNSMAFKTKMCVASCSKGMVDQPCIYEGSIICKRAAAKISL